MIKIFSARKAILLPLAFLLVYTNAALQAQNLTLQTCQSMARENYPLIKQHDLIEKTKKYSVAKTRKGYLPQFSIGGSVTYQSEVTHLSVLLPNINITSPDKDQYKLYGEVSQSITDLFIVKAQKNFAVANAEVEGQKLQVELYKIRERIRNLFFGVLLIDAQIRQTQLLKKDIANGLARVKTAVANGTALQSATDNLKAELLKAEQRATELKASRKSYIKALSLFVGTSLDENTLFEKPMSPFVDDVINNNVINRPELELFAWQKKSLEAQKKLLNIKGLPRVNLFFQGGIGRPALNMLSNDFEGYYVTGLRLHWGLQGFYTVQDEKKMLDTQSKSIGVQKETFLFNVNLAIEQQKITIDKILRLIAADKEIVVLRESVKKSTQNQLQYGTATTSDYLTAVNAEDFAKQNLLLHEIQLLLSKYNLQEIIGETNPSTNTNNNIYNNENGNKNEK